MVLEASNDFERPGCLVLSEGAYSKNAYFPLWEKQFSDYLPKRGIHFLSVDIFNSVREKVINRKSSLGELDKEMYDPFRICDNELANNIELMTGAVLIARGGLSCLIAQYYLESRSLAGLVLVDPVLTPDTVRDDNANYQTQRLNSSASRYFKTARFQYENDGQDVVSPDGIVTNDDAALTMNCSSSQRMKETENHLLQWLQLKGSKGQRLLRLEKGSVPTLVLCSVGHDEEAFYQECAKYTASLHNDENSPWGKVDIRQINVLESPNMVAKQILEWYDENIL